MKYYEIVIMINIHYQNKIENLIESYNNKILLNLGKIDKLEKIGIRNLCYPIKKLKEAYYIIMNIKCEISFIKKFEKDIKSNEIIIRYIILNIKKPNLNKLKLSD